MSELKQGKGGIRDTAIGSGWRLIFDNDTRQKITETG